MLALRVCPARERFVDGVANSLIDAATEPEGHPWIRAVVADGVPVGFVMVSWGVVPVPVDTRAGRWLLGATAGLTVTTVVVFVVWGEAADATFMGLVGVATLPLSVLLPVLGIMTATAEWSQRTGLVTFALEPRRGRVVLAKIVAVTRLGLSVVISTLVVAGLAHLVGSLVREAPADWPYDRAVVAGVLLSLVINLVQGMAFGLALLNTPLAIVASMLLPTVFTVTSIVGGVEQVTHWLDLFLATEPLAAGKPGRWPGRTGPTWARRRSCGSVSPSASAPGGC